MSLSVVVYLLQIYWPFLLIALVIGVATGWYSENDAERGTKP